jgi:hypothetical protein
VLDDLSLVNDLPGDYRRLCDDRDAQWGHPPVIANGTWRQTNASRYVRRFQSRRSLLAWKVFGERDFELARRGTAIKLCPSDRGSNLACVSIGGVR